MEVNELLNNIFKGASKAPLQRLSVILTSDSLCLFSYDTNHLLQSIDTIDRKTFKNIREILAALKAGFSFQRIDFYYANDRFSLMPRTLFQYGDESLYIDSVSSITENDIVFTDQNDAEQIVNIYAVNLLEDLIIRQTFDGVHTRHLASEIVGSTKLSIDKLYIYILEEISFLVSVMSDKPQFISCFRYVSNEDFIYQIGRIVETSKISTSNIVLAGIIDQESKVVQNLQKYYPQAKLLNSKKELNASLFVR